MKHDSWLTPQEKARMLRQYDQAPLGKDGRHERGFNTFLAREYGISKHHLAKLILEHNQAKREQKAG